MSQVSERDMEVIKEWLSKEPHLPSIFGDIVIKKFIYSCNHSLERTKQCVEEFCKRRANMPEIYTNRDPLSKAIQNAFAATTVTTYLCGTDEMLIHQLNELPSDFNFYDLLKAFSMQADNWLRHEYDDLPENHIIVLDIKLYTIKLATKVNIFYLQKFFIYLLETMPVKLTQIHLINCPAFYEYLINLVKPALPEYLCNLLHFHQDHTGLQDFIDKKYLPKDFGGDAEPIAVQSAHWVNRVCEQRNIFLDESYWRVDLSMKKIKNNDSSMNGSFKSLQID